MTDMKLQNEVERSELEQTMQLEELKHVHSMQHSKLVHKLALDKQEQENRIKRLGATHVAQLEVGIFSSPLRPFWLPLRLDLSGKV